jgi:hypothetical protein
MAELRFEPINAEIQRVTLQEDEEGGITAVVEWRGKARDTAKVFQFDYGEQGTWARLLLSDGRQLCITQSGTMQPSCYYIIGEQIPVHEEPTVVIG